MTLPRSVELRWQREVIERWLHTPGIPADAHTNLVQMLKQLETETDDSTLSTKEVHERGKRVAGGR